MIKKKNIFFGKRFLAGVVVVAFGIMGTSYATWTKEHAVKTRVSTDKFDFKLGESVYEAHIVDLNGTSMDLLNFTVNEIDEEKNAELSFGSGIPAELLEEGKYLKITFPVEAVDAQDQTKLFEYEVDFSKEETIIGHAKDGLLSIGGTSYEYPNLPKEFMQDIKFHVYRSVERNGKKYYGNVYLELADESRDAILSLPTEILLDTKLEELTLSDKESEYDGVMVSYDTQISFHLEQFNIKGK